MKDNGILRTDPVQIVQRLTARNQIVLGKGFKEIDGRSFGENRFVMIGS